MTVRRLASGGRIDRATPVRFQLEGRTLSGFQGDTLASALLANDVRIVGRSFKYHRPRGVLAASAQEPNALLTVGAGDRRTPNLPATLVDLFEGLVCERQNGWPSVERDVGSLLGLFSPLISAGFYYKTFMGPTRGAWMFYERWIRRTAGLGKATHRPDPSRYETEHRHTDVLIIGAGPAGMAAALAAGRAGSRVLLVEQEALVGGSLLHGAVGSADDRCGFGLLEQLAVLPTVELLTRTTAFGVYDGQTVGLVSRIPGAFGGSAEPPYARETLHVVRAQQIIYATGALEQPLVFGNNDLPGILLAGAVREYLHRFALRLGERVVVLSQHDSAWDTALDLAEAGAAVTVVEARDRVSDDLLARAAKRSVTVRLGAVPVTAHGSRAVRGVTVVALADHRTEYFACDLVAMSGGWTPTVQLTTHTGVKAVYDPALRVHVPGPLPANQQVVGAARGIVRNPLAEGHTAGERAARDCGYDGAVGVAADAHWADVPLMAAGVPRAPSVQGKAFVDFQSDVTVADIDLSLEDGFESPEHLKRYTALGMATDQGKNSHHNGLQLLAERRAKDVGSLGTTTHRPPYTPVTVGALAGRSVGLHFRPTRRTPMHDWHQENGATFIEAGPWLRPWYYRWAGADVATAYVNEMRLVRSSVGLSDVSSLGKIELTGPDVGLFLDRVYVNGFSSLAVGKARYGVMLNDDGTVLDDGTTARFGTHRYFMTTTTAQAGEVMSWLEFLLQTAWPDLRVQAVSVTDRWAAMSIAGPKSREVLAQALPQLDVSGAALPHMGVLEAEWDGRPIRVARLSFSGELAYEVYVPADHGIAMWTHLLDVGAPAGIRPYGLEALASLRIEKGHVAGIELDHRNTLADLGLGKMASRTKAYVGRELSQRSELVAADRWSLVGLELLEPSGTLRGGAILFADGEPMVGHGRGYITSVTWSTVYERLIALGLYQGGLAHVGEVVVCAYPLRGEQVKARIVSPMFIDPAGERLHA